MIRIYSDLTTNSIFFEGSTVSAKPVGEVEAVAHPTLNNRVIIRSTTKFKRGSDTVYRVFFRKLKITRIADGEGQALTEAPLNLGRDEVLVYLNEQFTKPKVIEYFEYNPDTDRLKATKAIETTLNSLFLGSQHRISSGAANIYFDDLTTGISHFPVTGGLEEQSLPANQLPGAGFNTPKARIFGDFGSVPLGGAPVDDTAIAYDGDNFFSFNISGVGITTRVAEAVSADQQLKYELSVNGTPVYVQYLQHDGLSVNEDLTWYFTHPLDIEAGSTNHASIRKVATIGNQEVDQGLLMVCEGDDVATRYQTNVLHRLFDDKDVAFKEDIDAILSGSIYKGGYNAATDTPTLPTGSDSLGDFYRVTAAGGSYAVGDILVYNGTDYDHIPEGSISQQDVLTSALRVHDVYVKAGYVGAVSDGSILYPFADVATAVASASDGDSIYLDGVFSIPAEVVLPADKSLYFYGSDDACVQYATYDAANGDVFSYVGDGTKELKFVNITFKNAGGYGLLLKKTTKTTVENCTFKNNGWNGTALNTVLPSTTTALLGYDSSSADLQAFYAGANASNGGAMRLEEATQVLVIGNTVTNNLRGIRVQDCGVGGAGVISRNQSTQNIESGIYIAAGGTYYGCQNVTVMMNVSAYNANNGLLVIGGLNNKFSQNEVNGNWNAGFCAWGAANSTLRDCGLYDNNRSQYNGIGNTGDAKASIQINEAYNLLGTSISLNPAARFIAEILDTQVHYTGLGSNTEKIGMLITSGVGALTDNDKNIIKVDDVGFIGQDYAIDLSEVDVSNLRISLGDNSYQTIGVAAVKPPIAGNYSELPFSNHVMSIPSVDVVVDTIKQTIALKEYVSGNVINVYAVNELQSVMNASTIDIIQKSSDKIQLRGLTFGSIYINGVAAGNSLNSANDSLNAAFSMNLVQYKDFLTSEVGVNGDASSGGSLPAIANNWYISYGSQAGTQITSSTIGNAFRNYNPFYNGEALEQGHEFVWTLTPTIDFMIGLWTGAEATQSGTDSLLASNWSQGFFLNGNLSGQATSWSQSQSSGVTVTANGSVPGEYAMPNGQVALRFGQDGYLYLFEIVSGGYSLIAKSNDTVAGTSIMVQWSSFNQGSFPSMTERTETWEVIADEDNNLNGEWSGGLEESTVVRSRMSFSPGEKITLNMSYFGRSETIGFGYSGTATGQSNAQDMLTSPLKYPTTEILKSVTDDGVDWTWNTEAAKSYDPNGNGSDIGYGTANVNIGLISFRYKLDNTLEMWHETDNVLMATKVIPFDGTAQKIFIGSNEDNHAASRLPALTKYDMSAEEEGASITGWYYIESPDGSFYYPIFKTEAEANYIDSTEGGSGTSHTHTFADDPTGTTWYMPDTNGTHAGAAAPQGGVWGNSINVVWNEQETGADAGYVPTFTNITYNVQEGSAINIQYKAAGMTDTFNVTNVPAGYADNGYAIIGTAEDITNGYGQSVTHTINVTKANDFGSVQGTITINVLANLAGNEFTIVDQGGAIKFTQDGATTLDFSTVTFNAGSTYKFYVDGATLQTNDVFDIVDASGNTVTGNDGLSMLGGSGPGYAGTYFQYAIPTDVEPGKFLTLTDGATSTAYADVPLTLAGSTYTAGVTGITRQGPAASQTGTNGADAGTFAWATIDDTLTAGQRLVLSGTFLKDLVDEMSPNSTIFIGVKDSDFNSASISSVSLINGSGISLEMNGSGTVGFYAVGGYFNVVPSTIVSNYSAFIEISSDGNSIRFGATNNSSTDNAVTTAYSDWNGAGKIDTGDQGYGITNAEIAIRFNNYTSASDFDANEIDWTGLSEVSVPAAASNETSWTKALDFSGSNEHLKMVGSSYNPIRMGGLSVTTSTPGTGNTSSDSNARPWATAIVFSSDNNNSNQHIWNQGEGATNNDDNIYLRVTGSRDLYFGWGRSGALNECYLGSLPSGSGNWNGIYIAHNGTRLSGANATATNLAGCFDIRNVNLSTGVAGSNLSTSSNWQSSGGRMDRSVTGDFTIGGRGGNRNFHGKVASMVMGTLRTNMPMPDATEIGLMVTDPKQWEDDYKDGQFVRWVNSASFSGYTPSNPNIGYGAVQIWLMGDGTNDSFANGIRNQVYPTDQNNTKLQLNSMVSNDIQNVTITGLS